MCFRGDLTVIKRIAVEFCEDEARNGVCYVEARFSPHLKVCPNSPEVTPRHIVQAVLDGFKEGEEKFGIKVGWQNMSP